MKHLCQTIDCSGFPTHFGILVSIHFSLRISDFFWLCLRSFILAFFFASGLKCCAQLTVQLTEAALQAASPGLLWSSDFCRPPSLINYNCLARPNQTRDCRRTCRCHLKMKSELHLVECSAHINGISYGICIYMASLLPNFIGHCNTLHCISWHFKCRRRHCEIFWHLKASAPLLTASCGQVEHRGTDSGTGESAQWIHS